MDRSRVNYALDWGTYGILTALAATGLLIHFTLPPGNGRAEVFGLNRHEWGDVHFWLALGLLAAVVVHLLLHASWIKALTMGRRESRGRRWRAVAAVAAAVVLGALSLLAFFAPVEQGEGRGRGHETAGQMHGGQR